jgi:hypothetical protein
MRTTNRHEQAKPAALFHLAYLAALLGQYTVAAIGLWVVPLRLFVLTSATVLADFLSDGEAFAASHNLNSSASEMQPLLGGSAASSYALQALKNLRAYASGRSQAPSAENSSGWQGSHPSTFPPICCSSV